MKKLLLALLLALGMLAIQGGLLPAWADCPDAKIDCWGPPQDGNQRVKCGQVTVGACYQYLEMVCKPCGYNDWCSNYKPKCNAQFSNCCQGKCWVYWKGWQGSDGGCYPDNWKPPY